ncbi:MAG: hypothetical protein AABW79_02425 [Nanoarchaeota archaeon]
MKVSTKQKIINYTSIAVGVLCVAYTLGRETDRVVATAKIEAIYQKDINGDERKDIVMKFRAGNYSVLLQNEKGNFIRDTSISSKDIASKLE